MISLIKINEAAERIKEAIVPTPLDYSINFSEEYNCKIFFKREDLHPVRSFKIRGAYNKISSLTPEEKNKGLVCASSGNFAQSVAFTCNMFKINCKIFMPANAPDLKINKVKKFGKEFAEVLIHGNTFDECNEKAVEYGTLHDLKFIHPFDDEEVIAGQATAAVEILAQHPELIDYLFVPVGGGGLISGIASYIKQKSPETKIIAAEPAGAPALDVSLKNGINTTLSDIDCFADGAAVKRIGEINFEICRETVDAIITIPEGKISSTIIKLYNEEALVVEPAGALSISALDYFKEQIKNKTVVCILSGSNNDIERIAEIKKRSLAYENLMRI